MQLLVLLASLVSSVAQAQQVPEPTQASTPPTTAGQKGTSQPSRKSLQQKSEAEKQIEHKEQSQRVLGVIPDFGVTSRKDAPALTPREKFHLFATEAFDPATIGIVGLQAGLSQAEDEFPAYGQGAQGYGKRFGASLADEVSSSFWTNFFYPSLLKEDPRYFRLGEGGFGHRFFYSFRQQVVCHTDKGGRSFNFSNVLGAFTSGAISNLYYPGRSVVRTTPATATTAAIPVYEDDRGFTLTMSRSAIALGYGVVGGLFDEFWPDVQRKFRHKREGSPPNQHP